VSEEKISDDARQIWLCLQKDEFGGEWKKHIPKDDPDYDPEADWDPVAEDCKHTGRGAWANIFQDSGDKSRIHWDWADFCWECRFCKEAGPENFVCNKLHTNMARYEVEEKKKRPDCPQGFDYNEFVKRREAEIDDEHLEWKRNRAKEILRSIFDEQGKTRFDEVIKTVRDDVKSEIARNKKSKVNKNES